MEQSQYTFKVGAQWEWQSNANPWGSEKSQWEPYTPFYNYLLEEAYFNKQDEVDLGDYIVSIKHLLQKKKGDMFRQRKVRRNEEVFKQMQGFKMNEQESSRTKRFFGAERPKTYNKTFGSLKDFVLFFSNRGPEIKSFANKFQKIEDSKDLGRLNQEIVPLLIDAIRKESASKKEKQIEEVPFISLFQVIFQSFTEFYGNILRAYTVEGFLYRNLNRYLRNEDWTLLDCLLPYAFCLFKAFLWSELTSVASTNPQNPKGDFGQHSKMIVYRGAQLDKISLSFYNPQTVPIFSWNAVTSTSRNPNIAENFMNINKDSEKIPVMFVIEVPINPDNRNGSTWIDIKPYSAFPAEDEIVLSPGSTFKLMNIFGNITGVEIQLKLVTEVSKLAHQGHIMHGAMQAEMTMSSVSRIVGLEGSELGEALHHLKGNGLIEELELALCKFDYSRLAILIGTLPTIPKLAKLSCVSISLNWNDLLNSLMNQNIKSLEIHNQRVMDKESLKLLAHGVKYLTSLTTLNFSFEECYNITDEGLNTLCSQGIRHLTSLTSLNLSFNRCYQITNQGLNNLCSQGIRHLTSLTALNLSFEGCSEITDEGLTNLFSQGIRHLTSLTALNLSFSCSRRIKDKGLNNLCSQGLRHMTSLRDLNLSFKQCYEITGVGLNNLCCQGIYYLTSLTSLKLDFQGCDITDEWLKNMCVGIRRLKSLTALNLNFTQCSQITEQGLMSLNFQVYEIGVPFVLNEPTLDYSEKREHQWKRELKNKSSNDINPNFGINSFNHMNMTPINLSDELFYDEKEFIAFGCEELRRATSSTALNLCFNWCSLLTDEGLSNLCSQGIRHRTSLTTLDLSFQRCRKITDEGLNNLCYQGIRYLTSLTTLNLSFAECAKITDKGLNNLCSQGIRHLTSLTALNLSFKSCEQITDEGLNNLCSQGIRHLTSLTALKLSFDQCYQITNQGLNNLCSQGIRHLTSLTTLYLNFSHCPNISNTGVRNLALFLKYFGFHPQSLHNSLHNQPIPKGLLF